MITNKAILDTRDIKTQEPNPNQRHGAVILGGRAGSGKTTSAIVFACGMMSIKHPELLANTEKYEKYFYKDYTALSDKVGIIDTENRADRSADKIYADSKGRVYKVGKFQLISLKPPFHRDRILSAMDKLIKSGCEVIIIDSLTDWWNEASAEMSKKPMGAWQAFNLEHRDFIQQIFNNDKVSIILCVQAKDNTTMLKDPQTGKVEVKNLGLKLDIREKLTFEAQEIMMINDKHKARKFLKSDFDLFLDGQQLSPHHGAIYYAYQSGMMNEHAKYIYKIACLRDIYPGVADFITEWKTEKEIDESQPVRKLDTLLVAELYYKLVHHFIGIDDEIDEEDYE